MWNRWFSHRRHSGDCCSFIIGLPTRVTGFGSLSELHYRREKYIEQYIVADGGDWWNTQPSLSYNNTYAGDRVRSYHTEYYWTTCTKVLKTYPR